jgi:hypothetical protein
MQLGTQPTYAPIERGTITDLRNRIDSVVQDLETAGFSASVIARALLVEGADRLVEIYGPLAAGWMAARLEGLLAGQWTPDTQNLFIESYRK